jgi:hypothetical protein
MPELTIRKQTVIEESIYSDGERERDDPLRKAAAVAVLENPYAGTWQDDLSTLTEWGARLGSELTATAAERLGGPGEIEGYGKGGVVGGDGELEHIAAMLHPELGTPMRNEVGGGDAIIPSAKKMGAPGTTLDVPTHYKDDAYVRSHFDAMEVRVPDAPRDDEILIALALTTGGRPHPRIGGRTKEEADADS